MRLLTVDFVQLIYGLFPDLVLLADQLVDPHSSTAASINNRQINLQSTI
jgi:hypothetical protein